MDNLIEFYRRTKAAQRLAEREGFLTTAAALERSAEAVLREFGGDAAVILCLTAHPALPAVGVLPIYSQDQR